MSRDIKESDWKYLSRKLKDTLLNRACGIINDQAIELLKNTSNKAQYQLFMDLFNHYDKKDDVISECFDDLKRSSALLKVVHLYRYGIITEAEIQGFSQQTRDFLNEYIKSANIAREEI